MNAPFMAEDLTPREPHRWVALLDGRLVVRQAGADPRPLTLVERIAWYLFRRVPR